MATSVKHGRTIGDLVAPVAAAAGLSDAGLESLRDLSVVGDVRGLGMMCGLELINSKETKEPAIGLGGRVAREAMSRGLIIRIRSGSADPAIGDTICVAPPLITPPETIDRTIEILRASIIAATR